MSRRIWPVALLVAASMGCGYSFGARTLYAHRSVRVPVSDNQSERRAHEFDLTEAVLRELQASGVRVNAHDASVSVETVIADISEPSLVEGRLDVVTVGSVAFKVRVTVTDLASGKTLVQEDRAESASFTSARGESRETARHQVLDRLARWVVSRLEKDW